MNVAAATQLLARYHWKMLLARTRYSLRENRLLTFTIAGFLGVYSLAAYLLVRKGIEFVERLPLLGPLLTERLIYLLFFFFFVMLIISNATITGMGLFRKQDTEWQHALPLPSRSIVLWKTLEGMLLASWGLLILSAPILIALGTVFDDGPVFYGTGILALLCMVTLCANISTWALLALVRWAKPSWWKPAGTAIAGLVVFALYRFWTALPEEARARDMVANLNEVLKHTEICMHPLLPSSWVAEAITASGHAYHDRTGFYLLLLIANALFALVVTARFASTLFPTAWQRVLTASTENSGTETKPTWFEHEGTPTSKPWLQRIFGLDRPGAAILLKDIRTFVREPVQWGQCALIFGLLFFYASNLRRLGYDLDKPFWISLVSYLNLVVCCLAVSTLTTRFIYPQFSMEGRRMWIIGPSPVPLERLLSLKLRLSASVIALLTAGLVVISSSSLALPLSQTLFFTAAIILMSYGLTSLALALGALLPNFRESNPARIVSGFGGTLCLINSFLYILLCVFVLVLPSWKQLQPNPLRPPPPLPDGSDQWLALLGVTILTIIFGGIPYSLAKKRTKKLEYLREL